jgi:pectinesterase
MFFRRLTRGAMAASLIALLLTASVCLAAPKTITVAADGSGNYKTVQEAVAAVPDNSAERTVVLIKPGTYQGPVVVPSAKINVTFQGQSPETTIITYDKNVRDPRPAGAHIFNPNLNVMGDGFRANGLTIQNTSGDHGQALAARLNADKVVFENCRLLGWQDTLLLDKGRYYFHDCYLEGRVDFIYGEGNAVFKDCTVHSKNGGFVTAASTKPDQPYGFVFLDCRLTGDATPWVDPTGNIPSQPATPTAYLGRPWRPYASVTYINCEMGSHISPEGWNNWGNPANEKTARYAEYGSKTLDGKPLDLSQRVSWAKKLTAAEAAAYTATHVLGGWNPVLPVTITPAGGK